MKEFKELSLYKNRGNSYIFIPYIVKAIKRIYKQPFVFVPNERTIIYQNDYATGSLYNTLGPKIPRNSPCPCGSGKKYKKCCLK